MRKRLFSFAMAACMLCLGTMTSCKAANLPADGGDTDRTSEPLAALRFTDVPQNAWYADGVAYCQARGIINGTTAATFSPESAMTRAMLATVLYRASGSPAVAAPPDFTDAENGAWYSDAIAWAAENGVFTGYGNGSFGVNDPTTREQAVTILWRYEGEPASGMGEAFSDAAVISAWARPAVRWADAAGVLDGMTADRRFAPKTNVTRGETAAMLYHGLRETGPQDIPSAPADSGKFDLETRTVTLNSGYTMPVNGLGTYSLTGETCVLSVTAALERGVRLIDTAYMYHNEAEVGRAVRESGIPREEIFVMTKLYPSQFANAESAIDEALEKLDIGYIDLMLLHHPGTGDVAAYRAMERAVAEGKIRSIGLSNWYVEELKAFLPQVTVTPALVQNEIHPYYQENDVIPYIQSLGIVMQGWYPLGGRGHTAELLGDPVIAAIAAEHGKSSAQVILRWNLQKGVVVIPGSSNPDHIQENTELFDFALTDEEMAQMNALDRNEKHDWY